MDRPAEKEPEKNQHRDCDAKDPQGLRHDHDSERIQRTITGDGGEEQLVLGPEYVDDLLEEDEAPHGHENARQHVLATRGAHEKLLEEHKATLPEAEADQIRKATEEVKKAMESDQTDVINQAIENLTKASHKLAELIYQKTASQQAGPSTPGPEEPKNESRKKDDGVIDAEFIDVDEKKN